MKAFLAALCLMAISATAADAGDDRYWDRENFRGARNAYQKEQQARRDWDRRFDRGHDARRHRELPPYVHPRPPIFVYRATPRVILIEPVGPIHAVPLSPPFIDSLGRSCREVWTETRFGDAYEGYGIACLHADGSWRLVS